MNEATASLQTGLFVSLSVTVLVLAVSLGFAFKHKPNLHIGGICAFLVTFGVTLYFAETLGRCFEFEHISYPIHMSLALWTTLFTLAPLITGFRFWKGKAKLETHKKVAWVWLASLVLALGTGIWMLQHGALKAEFRADAPAAGEAG